MENNVNILKETNFDSSLFATLDTKLTQAEYIDKLVHTLQPVLDQHFVNQAQKRNIRVHTDRISFACPYCDDSMKSMHAKRGNFILDGKYKNFFKCFNCNMFKRIDQFFKDFKVELELDTINFISDNLGDFTTQTGAKYDMSMLLDLGSIDKYAIDRREFRRYFGLIEAKDSPVWSWLTERLQFDQSKFLYHPTKGYLLMLNLTPSGKILGIQKRMFRGENRFNTFKLTKIYELMKLPAPPAEITNYLDDLSMIFNICLVDFSRNVTLFEGPMDAFLYKNSIANTGANKQVPIDIPLRYWFDDDQTGRKRAMEHLNNGEAVFLWYKFKRDIGLPDKSKWDLNDVRKWSKTNNVTLPSLDQYFSSDQLDLIDL